jgi:hypothetical protein
VEAGVIKQPFETSTLSDRARQRSAQRPFGLLVLAVLHVVGGIVLIVLLALYGITLRAAVAALENPLAELTLKPFILFFVLALIAGLTLSIGFGYWFRAKWSWWLGNFYYLFSFVLIANLAFMLLQKEGLTVNLGSPLLRAGIAYLLFKYVSSDRVMFYFHIVPDGSHPNWKFVTAACVAALLVLFGLDL